MLVSFKFKTLENESNMKDYIRIKNADSVPKYIRNKVNDYNITLVKIAHSLELNSKIKASKLEAEGQSSEILSQVMAYTIIFSDEAFEAFSINTLRNKFADVFRINGLVRDDILVYLKKYKEEVFTFRVSLEYKEEYCPYIIDVRFIKDKVEIDITHNTMTNKYYNIDLDKCKEITEIKSIYGA